MTTSNKRVGIYDFTSQLDYSLKTANERIGLLNNILYTDKGYPVEFFEDLFDQDARESANKSKSKDRKKYVNILPTTKQYLSFDIYECKQLEKFADYILKSLDQPRMDKQQEYTFYNERDFKRLIGKEDLYQNNLDKMRKNSESVDECDEGTGMAILGEMTSFPGRKNFSSKRIVRASYIAEDAKMAYLKRIGENYVTDNRQRITKSDLSDPELEYVKECETQIEKIRNRMADGKNNNKRWVYTSIIKSLTDSQIQYKDCKKGTIYFKDVLKGSTVIDYDEFDFFNKNHVLALLNMPVRQIAPDDDLSLVLYDLELLMNNIEIREEDLDIVNKYRGGISQDDIVKELGVSQQNVSQIINKLSDNVIQEYENIYEDWYYLDRVKGKYKKCSKCGEIKLHNKFRKDALKIDGLRYNCRQCDKK